MEKPTIHRNVKSIDFLTDKYGSIEIFDPYDDLLEELFLIRNPKYKFIPEYVKELQKFTEGFTTKSSLVESGSWVYFPWLNSAIHYLPEREHLEIHTARNKNLITQEEQEKFYTFKVGVAGLSVGSHGAITTALMGGAGFIKLADPDILSPTNLNRNRFTFAQIGVNKTHLVAQYIYQLNPYATIEVYDDGITSENIDDFLSELDILVEELDDIKVKADVRRRAKKLQIPVIMATDNADSVIMDIERFDLNPTLPIFHGNVTDTELEQVDSSPEAMYNAMAKIIDVNLVPSRVLHSVTEVGKTLYSWPQLASAATLSGATIAYTIRKIANKEPLNSGKLEISLEAILDPNFADSREQAQAEAQEFLKHLRQDG